VDGRRVAYVGHSFGGTSALQACRSDSRCAAAADLDGGQFGPVVRRGLRAPLLLVGHQGSCITALCEPANASERTDLTVARRLLHHTQGPAWSVSIDGTEHFDFTDYAAYYLALPLHSLLALGSTDGDRALQLTGRDLSSFLHASFGRTSAGLPRLPGTRVRSW
jgi:predicted dienelactone hydrolase